MKPRFIFSFLALIMMVNAFGQRSNIEFTFTAIDNSVYVQMDSIKVINRTQGCDTVLVWPDTVLSLIISGIPEIGKEGGLFKVFPNYPNPVTDYTTIAVFVPGKDYLSLAITDMLGRVIHTSGRLLDKGLHYFRFRPSGTGFCFFTAQWRGYSSSIKILHVSPGTDAVSSLDYVGSEPPPQNLKTAAEAMKFLFNMGDELLFIAYLDDLESGILDSPKANQAYTFQFATNIPCPGTPTVDYEGQVYNTIQVMSQCWLKENLNAGTMIQGYQNPSDNGLLEKYCYNNNQNNCITYGALYQWNEMMAYSTEPGSRGICPQGWHVPTAEEWRVLFGVVDSHYGIGAAEWDLPPTEFIGYDVGTNLKSTSGWSLNGNGTDLFGFSVLPGGFRNTLGSFKSVGAAGNLSASNEIKADSVAHLFVSYDHSEVGMSNFMFKTYGISVRCIRDQVHIPGFELTFDAVNNTSHIQLDSIKVMNKAKDAETALYGSDMTLYLPDELPFSPGDELLFIGYYGTQQSGILDAPEASQAYTFQFATNIPCPGTPTVDFEGQVYNTIQVMSQCWLKENLNAGTMIQGNQVPSDNGFIEKYCYNNNQDNCITHGALYGWNEMMAYSTVPGSRGICPQGWHVPKAEEWRVLFGAVDSHYGIGAAEWDLPSTELIGYDVGTNLKTTSGWNLNGNGTDLFGFSVLPGGFRNTSGSFGNIGEAGNLSTSNQIIASEAAHLFVPYDYSEVGLSDFMPKTYAISVRCLKDGSGPGN